MTSMPAAVMDEPGNVNGGDREVQEDGMTKMEVAMKLEEAHVLCDL